MTSVGIFDDHDLVVNSLSKLMDENGFEVVISSTKVRDFLEKTKQTDAIEFLIVDVVADDTIGLDLFTEILSNKFVKIIAYTSLTSPTLVANLFEIGVMGYVSKRGSSDDLLKAIQSVLANKRYVPEEYKFLTSQTPLKRKNIITERELEILRLISKGRTTKEMAEELFISVNTVESHRKNIFQKFEIKNVAELIMAGLENGYITQ